MKSLKVGAGRNMTMKLKACIHSQHTASPSKENTPWWGALRQVVPLTLQNHLPIGALPRNSEITESRKSYPQVSLYSLVCN